MTNSSFVFLRVRGIPIGAHWTWLFVFVLLVSNLVQVFSRTAEGLTQGAYIGMAVLTSLLFFASIVLHELGHAFRALEEGMRIEGITLWLFGGVARFSGTFPGPGAEFRVAIAGPAVSLLIAAVTWGVALAADALGQPEAVDAVFTYLAQINAILVAFNLVPALPLDGGRVLRAALWRRQGSYMAATASAAKAGRAFGMVLIAMSIAGILTEGPANSVMFAILGWFLLQAAGAEAAYAFTVGALDRLTAGDVMTPGPAVVAPGTTVARFFDEITRARPQSAYPVAGSGGVAGLVAVQQAGAVPPHAREHTTVDQIMLRGVPVLRRSTPALESLESLQGGAPAAVVATEDGQVEGILTVPDLARAVEVERARGASGEGVRPVGWWVWGLVVTAMALCVGALYRPPYLVVAPGPAIDLSQDVRITGTEVHPVSGEYLLVSVRIGRPTALGLAWAAVRPDQEVIPESSVDFEAVDQVAVFEQSRQLAAAAAARAAGLDVRLSGTGARVVRAVEGAPADGILRTGDVIVAIDGKTVVQDADVRDAVRARRRGTTFRLTVERRGQLIDLEVRSAAVQRGGPPAIGVFLATRDFDIDLPFEVDFRDRPGIGGPSAGLTYALVIAEMLGADDLARDRTIAATGTVDVEGDVGVIGGVVEKAHAARDRSATLFLVPGEEADDVRVAGLEVAGVDTLDEALEALRRAS